MWEMLVTFAIGFGFGIFVTTERVRSSPRWVHPSLIEDYKRLQDYERRREIQDKRARGGYDR